MGYTLGQDPSFIQVLTVIFDELISDLEENDLKIILIIY